MSRFAFSTVAAALIFSSISLAASAETVSSAPTQTAAIATQDTTAAPRQVARDMSILVWGVKVYPGSTLGTGDHNQEIEYWGLKGSK